MKQLLLLLGVLVHVGAHSQTATICNQAVPAGWVTISIGQCGPSNTTGNTFMSRTIRRVDNLANGTSVQVCGENTTPAGWVNTAMLGACGPSNAYLYRTITRIDGMANGTSIQVCGENNTPTGWVNTAMLGACGPYNAYLYRTITRIDGMPIGTSIQVCGQNTTPAGWVSSATLRACGPSNAYAYRTITRVSSGQRLMSNAVASDELSSEVAKPLVVTPNPASRVVEVRTAAELATPGQGVEILDMFGVVVKRASLAEGTATVPLDLPAGIYLVKVGASSQRLQVQ